MKRIIAVILAVAALAAILPGPVRALEMKPVINPAAVELRMSMRKLWEDHIGYTRSLITSALAGLEDAAAVQERLLRNQDDIGNAIKPLYGEEAGKQLSALLRAHIGIAAEVVAAAKAGKQADLDAGSKKWKANADDLATFLSGANPHWPKATLQDMLYKHLDQTTASVVARLRKDWAADIKAYDEGHTHMMAVADALTDGIVKQFPDKFRAVETATSK